VVSQAQIEKKVRDYLQNSQVLADYRQRPITAQQLQAEMDRMAQNTRQPEMLQELFEALGNDPFVIAECLARPRLAERLLAHPEVERVNQQSRTRGILLGERGYRARFAKDLDMTARRIPVVDIPARKPKLHAL
jgi:hypothetical protein